MKITRLITILCCPAIAITLTLAGTRQLGAANAAPNHPQWSNPSVMALKRINSVAGHQTEPNYFNNLDCTLQTYRMVGTTEMKNGCFTPAAYGQVDSDNNTILFNGTDEGLPLLPHSAHQILFPWQRALNMLALNVTNSGGSYLSMYKNPLGVMQDQRNAFGSLTAKQLTAAPELNLTDSAGKPLVVNGQSLAVSETGSWLIAEVIGGSFTRINLATLDMKPFAISYSRSGSPALDQSSVTVSRDGRYVAVENTYATDFKVYDLQNCSGAICVSYNYWPFITRQISGMTYISHVRFINDGLLSFDAASRTPDSGGSYEISPTTSITSLIDYLALGDSYTSGEGAFDYLDGTDTGNNVCHESSHSYPTLLTHDLFTSAGGHSVACSGAVIHDITNISTGYRGQVRGVQDWQHLSQDQPALLASIMANYLPGYVAQQRFVNEYQPARVSIGIGGNDIGFGDILVRCAVPHPSLHTDQNTCFATYEDRQELLSTISMVGQKLRASYQQLQAASPASNLYAIGYPLIAVDNGSCALNVHFNTSELEFIHELINRLNATISGAAQAADIQYVDISQALAGHRLCETAGSSSAVNGLTAGTDAGIGSFDFIGNESYHPNALGHQLIERAILTQTNKLRLYRQPTAITVPQTNPTFLAVPKTGRPVYRVHHDPVLTPAKLVAGKPATITVDRLEYGLPANAVLTVLIDGSQSTVIGSLGPDAQPIVTIPQGTSAGTHTIDVISTGQDGQTVHITKSVIILPVIIGSGNNTVQTVCALIGVSGQDVDGDGIDDACDPIIGPATATPGTANSAVVSSATTSTGIGSAITTYQVPVSTTIKQPATNTYGVVQVVQPAAAQNNWVGGGQLGIKQTSGELPTNKLNGAIVYFSDTSKRQAQAVKSALPLNIRPKLPVIYWWWWLIAALLGYTLTKAILKLSENKKL